MKRLSETENDLVLEIPLILGVGIVRVQPTVIAIVLDIEHVRIATGIGIVHASIRTTAL